MVGKRIKAPGLVLGVLLMTIVPGVEIGPVPVAIAQTNPAAQKAEAERLLQQGIQQYRISQFEAALQSWQQALILYRSINDRWGEGNTLGNLGIAYSSMGVYDKAIEYARQSLVIAQEVHDYRGEGQSLGNLGNAYFFLGNYDQAIAYHEKSLAIARKLKNRRSEGRSLNSLGLTYHALGRYSQAIDYYQQRLVIAQEMNDQRGLESALTNLGNTYNALGAHNKAIEYYQQSITIAQTIKDRSSEANAIGNLGNAYYALGDYDKAIQLQEFRLAVVREIKDRRGEGQVLGNLGNIYKAQGDYERGIKYYHQSLVIAQEIKDQRAEGRTLGSLGNIYYELERYDKAIDYHRQSLAIARRIKDDRTEGSTLTNLGLALFQLNQLPEAEAMLRSGIVSRESLRPGLSDANKIFIADTQQNSYVTLQKVLIAQKQSEAALEIAERGRARALVELLASRFSNQSLTNLQNIIQAPSINTIRQIAKTQNATLVQYSIVGENLLYIWVIQPTGEIIFRSTQLDSSQPLAQLVSSSRSEMGVRGRAGIQIARQPTPSDQPNPLAKLYQSLIAPISQDLPTNPNQRVIFLPQGELFLVPFAALPDAQNRPLIERHTISTAPSIQTLALTQTLAQRPKASGSAVIVGDPKMPTYNGQPLQSLPAARQEAIAISQQLNTPPLIGAQATKATVLQQMPNARLLHFATHGLLDPVQGDIPGAIALTPSGQDNGFLSAAEIFNLKLNADLVVLSACDTGRGEITGDGVVGLSRSFIAAGAPSVIVSLWAVNDQSTSKLMQEFYRQLKQQPDKAQALRQAMLITKQRYPDPSHWAAFTLVGEAQ